MEIGLIRRVDIDHEMQQSYLDYAMSVIVSRALPDARDGLKPVQRRILYGMYELGLRADSAYKKSARIVGEVLGKYHPHGDQAVYEAMARLAQDFSMRYTLVDGQGNFGSVDGDPPAAMRYTEARLTPLSIDILTQLDRNTVDFTRNFDDSLNEPEVLPAAIPNLLVNGASGIAVGMATSVPPHNLGEVVDALQYVLEHWEKLEDVNVSDLMKFVKGPDFPTGGIILQESGNEDLLTAYATGRGKVVIRGKVHLEEMGRGKSRIIITELPYQTNKSSLIERIAEMARENNLEGISDLRDESDRQGMRIVIELNKVAEAENVLRELYKRTPLQSTFRISMLALVDGEPRLLSLKQALRVYLEHRINVIRRRSEYDLARARQRAHILEGLRVALNNLDEVINLIRKAQDVDDARQKLMKRFKLSDLQANAILEMPLRRLAALERKKIELEYKEVVEQIKNLEALLKSPKKLRQTVGEELQSMRQNYGDKRRTQIVSLREGEVARDLLTTTDVMPAAAVWVGVSEDGKIGRTATDTLPRVSGRQAPRFLCHTSTHDTLYLAARDGRAAAILVQSLPEVENFSDGVPVEKASPLQSDQTLAKLFAVPSRLEEGETHFIMTVTAQGMVKKSTVEELPGPSSQLFTLAKINPGDALITTLVTSGQNDIILATRKGMVIRFSEDEVRPMGLVAAGVGGVKLGADDLVVGAAKWLEKAELLLVGMDGKAWRFANDQLSKQGRYGQGNIACKPARNGELIGLAYGAPDLDVLVHHGELASRIVPINQIVSGRRGSVGKELVVVKPGDRLIGLTPIEDAMAYWEKRETIKIRAPRQKKEQPEIAVLKPLPGMESESQAVLPRKAVKSGEEKSISKPSGKKKVSTAKTGSTKTIDSAAKTRGSGTSAGGKLPVGSPKTVGKSTGTPAEKPVKPSGKMTKTGKAQSESKSRAADKPAGKGKTTKTGVAKKTTSKPAEAPTRTSPKPVKSGASKTGTKTPATKTGAVKPKKTGGS